MTQLKLQPNTRSSESLEHVLEPDRDFDPLKHLEERIDAAKQVHDNVPKTEEHYSAAQIGWRMVTELVTGLGIGFGIGYGLDITIGSSPFMMVIFTLLGFAAGIKTMMRSAREIQSGTTDASATEDDKRT